jgi:hypothetical protein
VMCSAASANSDQTTSESKFFVVILKHTIV